MLRHGIFVFVLMLVACATATRPPAVAVADAGDDAAVDDSDGEAEAADDAPDAAAPAELSGPCATGMALVEASGGRFCIDKYEASLVETDTDGTEKPFPHWLPVDGHSVRAVSVADVYPQGFISEVQAEDACAASNKRLCGYDEWKVACVGPAKTTFPYGEARQPGVCHDLGKSAVGTVFGARAMSDPVAVAPAKKPTTKKGTSKKTASRPPSMSGGRAAQTTVPRKTRPGQTPPPLRKKKATGKPAKASKKPAGVTDSVWTKLNDPRLGQVDGALAKTGSHEGCTNDYGVFDMVGNIHEWVMTDASLPHGTFAGGYFLDTSINGDGCKYRTTAHAHDYHDYSTGFRCCADPSP